MKTYKIFNYYRYESTTRPSVTNTFISMKMIVSICFTSLLIVLLMSSKISVGQEQPSLLQDANTPIIGTKSKVSQNTTEKLIVSDILRSATRNQYNTTNEQYATVLAPQTDGSIYSGVITFTASQPVRVEVQHPISLDNKTVNNKQLHGIIKYSNNKPFTASVIAPNYSNDSFSSSVFFTGKGLEFIYAKPFVVMYTVNVATDESNSTEGLANITQVEALEPAIGYQVNSGTLLTAVIPQLSDEILQELPFSDLDPADLSLIIRKVPEDKAGAIISKLPADQREEILSKLPADKRQEIVKNLTKQ